MANIALTPAAVILIKEIARDSQFDHPALKIGRVPHAKDLIRRSDGSPEWRLVDDGYWYTQVIGVVEPPPHPDKATLSALPGLILIADSATNDLVGTLTIDARHGQLEVISIAT